MRDEVLDDSADRMLRRTDDRDQLIRICQEYFEISLGMRKPSEEEKSEARRLTLSAAGFLGEESSPVNKVKVLKYPLSTDLRSLQLMYTLMEYEVYDILASTTDLLEAPYIPMLRYETILQTGLFEDDELELAVLRQSTILETYLRMKADLGQVKWKWTVESAYRGEEVFGAKTYEGLELLKEVRNDYAHNWHIYTTSDRRRLRRACRTGLRIIADFQSKELTETFQRNSSKHISQRHGVSWQARDSSIMTSNAARVRVAISCDHCGAKFDPQNNWKRCPSCDTLHRYWEI